MGDARWAWAATTVVVGLVACNLALDLGNYRACDGVECMDASDAQTTADVAIETGSTCPPQPQQKVCTTFPQSGCDAGQNCEVSSAATGATVCSAAGVNALWHNCNALGQCVAGSTCVGGVCKPYCCSASDCGGHQCVTANANSLPIPGLNVCNAGCDLLNPSSVCGPSVNCFPTPWNGSGHDEGNCYGPAGVGVGDGGCNGAPSGLLQCAPGYYCMPDAVCRKWCRVGYNADCPGDAGVCTSFINAPIIDNVEYGACF